MFIKMKFIYCHSCTIFIMKSISICNNLENYDEIITRCVLVFKKLF